MITSRVTRNGQTTIPQSIRAVLHLRAGDEIVYQIDVDRVILSKAQKNEADGDRFGTFTEWDSTADNKVYDKL